MGFNWGFGARANQTSGSYSLPDIFPLPIVNTIFTASDILTTYSSILTDVFERTHGLSEDQTATLWDNFVQSENTDGLITMLAKAMSKKSDLFLVYRKDLKLLRPATNQEQQQIKNDYAARGSSSVGVYISFKNYEKTNMLLIYSQLEYCVLASLHKTVNISKAVQIKIDSLRQSTSLADAGIGIAQAQEIAEALSDGNDVLIDAKDSITNATPDVTPTEKAMAFLDAKRAYVLSLPISYVSGLQTPGIGSSGEADMRAVERGLKQYFMAIVRPVCKVIFGASVEFKSLDFRQIQSGLEVLKTFDLVSDENLSRESKQQITARVFDIDLAKEKKNLQKEAKERDANEVNEPEIEIDGDFSE